jgi:membrane protein implicated in regulation of membrane protease activity
MDSPEQWRWVWIIGAAVFAVGEMLTPGSFFLAPFAVGALVAAILAFAGVGVATGWLVFIVVSIATLAALRPLARRLDRDALDHGVGARRLVGNRATVLRDIPGDTELGMVRIDREEWRAQSTDGAPIAAGTTVRVAEVQGTRVIVAVEAPPAVESDKPDIDSTSTDTP